MIKKSNKKLTKRALIISIIFVISIVFLCVAYVYGVDYYKKYYICPQLAIDSVRYPVIGIDISSHQGSIDWKIVSESKISFAFLKATEGESFIDKTFSDNWSKAKKENVVVGAYHFFRFNKDGKLQARNFINNVKLTDNDLPPVVDFESSYGNRFRKYTIKHVQNQLLKCLYELEKHYTQKPIIYTNIETYNKYIKGNFDDYPLWICKLCNEPSSTIKWNIWQYSHKGSVAGVKGNVDMNIFNGSYEEFIDFIYTSHNKKTEQNAKKQNGPTNRRDP